MVLMVCSSVFQLFVAISIKKAFLQDREVDLVLTDATPRFATLCKNEKLTEIFHSVRFAEICKNNNNLNRLERSKYGRMFFELFPRRYAKKVWGIDVKKYKECYFSSFITQNNLLQYAVKRNGKDAKIHMMEDGISTYLVKNGQKIYTPKILQMLFKIRSIEDIIDDVYVYEPELVCLEQYRTLVTIPKPQEIEGINDVLSELFEVPNYEIKEKFVFFEESFNNDGYVTNDSELINYVWKQCEGKDFILKHHPRNDINRFETVLPTMQAPIFWEVYLLNHSIDDKVLVTVSSNTVFVPHIIDGCKPTVVLLYKIFDGTSPVLESEIFNKYIEKYLDKYRQYTQEYFYIPETIDEYQQIIKKLKQKEG